MQNAQMDYVLNLLLIEKKKVIIQVDLSNIKLYLKEKLAYYQVKFTLQIYHINAKIDYMLKMKNIVIKIMIVLFSLPFINLVMEVVSQNRQNVILL